MNIDGKPYRTIWLGDDGVSVEIIDQTKLPFALEIVSLKTLEDAAHAISTMQVRGAPLIGATAAYGVALAMRADPSDEGLDRACEVLAATRPTAINLRWALDEMKKAVQNQPREERVAAAFARAAEICDEDVETCRKIGEHGVGLIRAHAEKKQRRDRSISSPIAMPAGSPRSIGARRSRRSTAPMTKASPSMCGWTRRGRAIRAPRSPRSSSGRMACRTPSSPTMPAVI